MPAIAHRQAAMLILMSTLVSNLFIWIAPSKRTEALQSVSGMSFVYPGVDSHYQVRIVAADNNPKFDGRTMGSSHHPAKSCPSQPPFSRAESLNRGSILRPIPHELVSVRVSVMAIATKVVFAAKRFLQTDVWCKTPRRYST